MAGKSLKTEKVQISAMAALVYTTHPSLPHSDVKALIKFDENWSKHLVLTPRTESVTE